MLTDPISDFLIRLKNASRAHKKQLAVRSSNLIFAIAELLLKKGYIEHVEKSSLEKIPELTISLHTSRPPLELKRISKPGQRIYVGYKEIKRVRNGLGLAVISTSRGVISGEEAKEAKLGGEYICEIY